MSNIAFLSGQLQATESKLLTVSRLDRMIGAKTPEDAFRVLVELQYSEYFDDSTRPTDFVRIIEQGLLETKKMIIDGVGDDPAVEFLFRRFDLNNIKRTLKLKFLENETSIEDFSEDNGFSNLGNLSKEDLSSLVFQNKTTEELPKEFIEVVSNAESIIENADFRVLEFALDRAHVNFLARMAKKSHSEFCRNFLQFIADSTNVRAVARSVLIFDEKLPREAYVSHGKIEISSLTELEKIEDFISFIKSTDFRSAISEITENDSIEEKMVKIERGIDQVFGQWINDSALGEIASVQIPIRYFEKRLQNARLIKFVMFAKFNGLSPEAIYKALKHF